VVWLVSARYVCSAHREPTSAVHMPSTSEPTSATALARGHASNVDVCTYDVLQLMDSAHTTSAVCARRCTRVRVSRWPRRFSQAGGRRGHGRLERTMRETVGVARPLSLSLTSEVRYHQNRRWLCRPMHVPTQKQWWSKRCTQRPQS
jgi:hypothetical protein